MLEYAEGKLELAGQVVEVALGSLLFVPSLRFLNPSSLRMEEGLEAMVSLVQAEHWVLPRPDYGMGTFHGLREAEEMEGMEARVAPVVEEPEVSPMALSALNRDSQL